MFFLEIKNIFFLFYHIINHIIINFNLKVDEFFIIVKF